MSSASLSIPFIKPHLLTYRLTFFVAGLSMGTWAPLVPFARERAGIDDGALGLLLLCLGLGSMVMMPLAGVLTAKKGCRFSMCLATALICLSLPLLATLSSFAGLAVALAFFGAGCGLADVTMNVQGVIAERSRGRSMMSGFHGLFSLGGIISAAGMSLLLWLGATPLNACLASVAIIASLVATHAHHMLGLSEEGAGPMFVKPTGKVLILGVLCFVAFLGEGAVLDWSAVFLINERQVDPSMAGLGYAAFAVMMAVGRLTGDHIQSRLGARLTLIIGGLIAFAGLILVVLSEDWRLNLFGFSMTGIGLSNLVPVYCSLAGEQRVMPAGLALAAITSIGYLGILMGPALIGFAAHSTNLVWALSGVAVLMAAVIFSAGAVIAAIKSEARH